MQVGCGFVFTNWRITPKSQPYAKTIMELFHIAVSKVPVFKSSKALKDAVTV